jgi:hypothetical protein
MFTRTADSAGKKFTKDLKREIGQYSLAAAWAGVSMSALAQPAAAEVVVTKKTIPLPLSPRYRWRNSLRLDTADRDDEPETARTLHVGQNHRLRLRNRGRHANSGGNGGNGGNTNAGFPKHRHSSWTIARHARCGGRRLAAVAARRSCRFEVRDEISSCFVQSISTQGDSQCVHD